VLLGEERALFAIEFGGDSRRELLPEVAPPGPDVVEPGDDPEVELTELVDREAARPAVVLELVHRHGLPPARAVVPELQLCAECAVTVGEHVCLDHDDVPDDALDRVAAAVDVGSHVLDGDLCGLIGPPDDALQHLLPVGCSWSQTPGRWVPGGSRVCASTRSPRGRTSPPYPRPFA
jgi:hypothetical protein